MNVMVSSRPGYQSYLLRLWTDRARNNWHASLQCTATGQVYHFASVEALYAFLLAQPAACAEKEGGDR